MPLLFWLDIAVLCFCAVISISLAMIALSFGPKYALNRYFGLFALSQTAWAVFSIGLRLALWQETDYTLLLLELATLAYVLMGPFLLMFTLRYLGRSTLMADRVAILGLIVIAIMSIPLFGHQLIMDPRLAPNGTTLADLSLWGAAAAGLPAGYLVWSLTFLWWHLRRTGEWYLALSVFILVIGLALGGVMQIPFPVTSLTNTLSVAILGYGVLSRQVLNPLRERTEELQRQIAERQRAETQLRLQSTALVAAANSIVIVNPDLTVVWVNPAFSRLTGYRPGEVIGKTLDILRSGAHDKASYQNMLTTIQSGQVWHGEMINRRKDGGLYTEEITITPVRSPGGEITHFIEIKQDITERKQAEAEVKRLNQDLEHRARQLAAINQAGRAITSTLNLDAVLKTVMDDVRSLLDAEGASVLLYDPLTDELVFTAVAGAGSDTLVGTRMPTTAGIAGWALRERQVALVQDAQHDSRFFANIDAETGLTTRSLVAVPLKFKAVVSGVLEAINKASGTFTQQDGEMLEALASSAAIAIENANLYTSLQEANVQLQTAVRAKDEMLQNVSHELRTPLAMIYGFSEALERGDLGPLTDGQQRTVQIIERQGERLRFMVDRLITLQTFEAQSLQRTRLDLSQWLLEAVPLWDVRAAQVGLALQVQVPSTLTVMADPNFLEHVVDNLLDNAIKFTPEGGRVQARAWVQGDEAIIAVSDTGVGIPPDKLQQVFERFYQVDGSSARRFGGMGIGLALCRAIVEAHGGRIWAESVGSDQGTTFYVALPLAKPEEGAAHAIDERPSP